MHNQPINLDREVICTACGYAHLLSERKSVNDSYNDTCPKCGAILYRLSNYPATDYQLLRPTTVGELRRFLEPFDDDCPLMAMNWGSFRYVLDGNGNGVVQYT